MWRFGKRFEALQIICHLYTHCIIIYGTVQVTVLVTRNLKVGIPNVSYDLHTIEDEVIVHEKSEH